LEAFEEQLKVWFHVSFQQAAKQDFSALANVQPLSATVFIRGGRAAVDLIVSQGKTRVQNSDAEERRHSSPNCSSERNGHVVAPHWKEEEGLFKPDDVAFEQSHREQGWSRVSINSHPPPTLPEAHSQNELKEDGRWIDGSVGVGFREPPGDEVRMVRGFVPENQRLQKSISP
jgi:hypothetical protein